MMRKIIIMFLSFALFTQISHTQRRPRPVETKKEFFSQQEIASNRQHQNKRPKQIQSNIDSIDNNQQISNSQLPKKKTNQTHLNEQKKEQDQINNARHPKKPKPQDLDRPLIKLIFLLVGALILIIVILLIKLFSKRGEKKKKNSSNQQQNDIIVEYPQINLQQQIDMHKKRLKQLQMLKGIKQKYLISNNLSSQMELARSQELSKKVQQQINTPQFKTPYTFRNAS